MVAPVEGHPVDVGEPPGIPRAVIRRLARLGFSPPGLCRRAGWSARKTTPGAARWSSMRRPQAGRGRTSVAPGLGRPRSPARGRSTRPSATSFQAMVSASHHPPRNQAWFTFAAGSETVAENAPSSHGLSFDPPPHRMNPPATGRTACWLLPGGHEVLGVEGEDRLERRLAAVGEPVFQRGDRQAGIVRVAGLERAPAGDLDAQRHLRIGERDGAEGKARLESGVRQSGAGRRWCPPAPLPVPGAPKSFQRRHRAFQHARRRSVCL